MTAAANVDFPQAAPRPGSRAVWLIYGANTLIAALFLLPWLLAAGISLAPDGALHTLPPTVLPWPIDISSYIKVLTVDNGRFLGYLRTSALVAGATAAAVVLVSGMAGYALAKLPFAMKELFFLGILGTMMFPFTAVLIPLFSIMGQLHLVNNPLALVILYTVLQAPFCTFLFRNSFSAIPNALRDAALVDGAGEWNVLWRIMLPLAKPALATVLIYSLYQSWNEFTIALIFLTSDTTATVPVGLVTLTTAGRFHTLPNIQMAGAVLSFLPILVLFLFFQRFFVSGLIAGSVKG